MKKIFFSFIFAISLSAVIYAQEDNNPINVLAEKLYENEMLSYHFLRDFVLIKSNTFKKKNSIDLDKTLARFDDNLSYIALHLPGDFRPNYIALQKEWNIYRMAIIDPKQKDYKRLVTATINIEKLSKRLRENVLENHPKYKMHKKAFHLLNPIAENKKDIDKMVIVYVFKNKLGFPIIENAIKINYKDTVKRLKKFSKSKLLSLQIQHIKDMNDIVNSIRKIYNDDSESLKLIYSKSKYFSSKNYILFKEVIKSLKNK